MSYVFVAVYGTLKKGNHNHNQHLGINPLKSGYYNIPVKIYSNGRYPMLIKSKESTKVFLEIYKIPVDKLNELDELETPFNYHREQLTLIPYDDVWIYFYTPNIIPEGFHFIENGNFKKEKEWFD